MRASTLAHALGLLLTASSLSAANSDENAADAAAPAAKAENEVDASQAREERDSREEGSVERKRLRAGAGLLLLPDLGPALELGVRVGGDVWVELEGWFAVSRLDDAHAPPAMGVGPRLSYRPLYPSWELRASLALPILQHDRQYVSQEGTEIDEVRDYLVPGVAPGVAAGYRIGPVTFGIDAELVIAMTEYFDYGVATNGAGRPELVSRGVTLRAFPKLALLASYAF